MSSEKEYQRKYHKEWAKKNRERLNAYCRNWRKKREKDGLAPILKQIRIASSALSKVNTLLASAR